MPEPASPGCDVAFSIDRRADDDPATMLARLASALVDVGPLNGALDSTPHVAPLGPNLAEPAELDVVQAVLDRLTRELSVRAPRVVADSSRLIAAELAISHRLDLATLLSRAGRLRDPSDALVAAAVRQAQLDRPAMTITAAPDGSTLRCYTTGPADAPAVVLVSACGMPVGLLRRWLAGLGSRFRVFTWESRGLFPARDTLDEDFDQRGYDVLTQAGDLHVVLDVFGVESAHVVGLCGGAAIALAAGSTAVALATGSPRVRSLSLWHGDYELGPEVPKTRHQQDVQSLMLMAGRQRKRAIGLHALLRRPSTLENLRADLAHELIYPYASAELLYRYGRLNGAIMATDCRALLAGIDLPTLVVSSRADTTAHPEGSVFVAARIPGARLELLPRGHHLAAFDAAPELIELAGGFFDEVERGQR